MAFLSLLFRNDASLEAAAVSDPAHITQGASGGHVLKIQSALMILDGANVDAFELKGSLYGPSTAACVKAYKKKRDIVNRSYQTQADDIVGKMTISILDREMFAIEQNESNRVCNRKENPHVNPNSLPSA